MSKLLYNGVELPAVPTHDADATVEVISAVLPAALSMYAQSPYILVIGKGTLWQSGKCYVRGVSAVYRLSGDAWMWHYGSGTVSTQDIVAANYFEAIWTNTDIPTADGAGIYLAASAPVDPNAPEEPAPEEPPVEPNVDVAAIYRRGWMDGFLSGINIRGLLRRRKVEEPQPVTAYLYGTPSPTIVTYNGVELPELPEWDKETYPYAYLQNLSSGKIMFVVMSSPMAYGTWTNPNTGKDLTNFHLKTPAGSINYVRRYTWDGAEWYVSSEQTYDKTEATEDYYSAYSSVVWSNTDIPNVDDGTTYLAASEPVYKQVGGNLYLADVDEWEMYKGAVLPFLPEYDKSKYPCAYIQYSDGTNNGIYLAYLMLAETFTFKAPLFGSGSNVEVPSGSLRYSLMWNEGEAVPTEWGEPTTLTASHSAIVDVITWSNTDILTSDGSLYLAASEPLEVASSEPVYKFDFDQPFPALPSDISEQGDYLFIGRVYNDRSEPVLLATSVQPIWKGDYYGFPSETIYSQYRIKNNAWQYDTGGKTSILTWRVMEWNDFDILDSSGAVHLAASEYPESYKMEYPIYETKGMNEMGIDILSMVRKATPKTIDLREYTVTDSAGDDITLNNLALSLYAMEGGTTDPLSGAEAFWEAVNTEQSLRLVIDGSAMGLASLLEMNGVSRVVGTESSPFYGKPTQISGSFKGIIGGTTPMMFTWVFDRITGSEGEHYRMTIIVEGGTA